MTSRNKALLLAELAESKKAEDIVIMDMRKVSNITDFFVIATASSARRAQTIKDAIEEALKKAKQPIPSIEGVKEADWILVDAFDVCVHIFNKDLREFYDLEGLWKDAKRVGVCQKPKNKRSKKSSKRK